MRQDGRVRRAVGPLLAVTVALVLADSAVVTLALPDILQHLDTTVAQVAWVLISFNLVLGLARGADGGGLRARGRAGPRRGRDRGVRRRVGMVRCGAVDRGADRGSVRAGARRRTGAGRVPRAPGRGVRRAPRDRHLDHGRRDRHGHRPVRWWAADTGVLLAGDLRGPGADRGARRSGGARGARRTRSRARPERSGAAPPGGASQPHPRLPLGGAHSGAVPAGPAPGRRLAALPGGRGHHRVRRTGRGARRPAAGSAPASRLPRSRSRWGAS